MDKREAKRAVIRYAKDLLDKNSESLFEFAGVEDGPAEDQHRLSGALEEFLEELERRSVYRPVATHPDDWDDFVKWSDAGNSSLDK